MNEDRRSWTAGVVHFNTARLFCDENDKALKRHGRVWRFKTFPFHDERSDVLSELQLQWTGQRCQNWWMMYQLGLFCWRSCKKCSWTKVWKHAREEWTSLPLTRLFSTSKRPVVLTDAFRLSNMSWPFQTSFFKRCCWVSFEIDAVSRWTRVMFYQASVVLILQPVQTDTNDVSSNSRQGETIRSLTGIFWRKIIENRDNYQKCPNLSHNFKSAQNYLL